MFAMAGIVGSLSEARNPTRRNRILALDVFKVSAPHIIGEFLMSFFLPEKKRISGSTIAGIWHEFRELSLSFISFICSHVNREGNEPAHVRARRASMSSPVLSWIGVLPDWLREVAIRDCNGVMQ